MLIKAIVVKYQHTCIIFMKEKKPHQEKSRPSLKVFIVYCYCYTTVNIFLQGKKEKIIMNKKKHLIFDTVTSCSCSSLQPPAAIVTYQLCFELSHNLLLFVVLELGVFPGISPCRVIQVDVGLKP